MVICLPQGVRSCGRFALFMRKFFLGYTEKGRPVSCQQQENAFLQIPILHCGKGPKVSKGRPESPLVASAEAKSFVMREKKGRLVSCLPQGSCFIYKFLLAAKGRRFPKGDRKALWSPPQRRNPLRCGEKKGRPFSCLPQGNCFIYKFLACCKGPKVSKGRPESPLVASAEAKSSADTEKKGRPFSCLPQEVCFA